MSRQASAAYVLGVGMTKFIKPRGKVECKLAVIQAQLARAQVTNL